MGVVSYREDDLYRYLEATETVPAFGPPGPPRHHWPFCAESFEDGHRLREHLSSSPHGDRPVLLIAGREPDQTSTISQLLLTDQISIENCSAVSVRFNGVLQNDMELQSVATLLSRETNAIIELELVNRFDEVATPIHQSYRLVLRIPEKASVDAVDQAFMEHLATSTPRMEQVAAFLQDSRCMGVASDYADALGSYVRGLLVKDQAIGTGVTMRPAVAEDFYGAALEGLKGFHSPLAAVVCGLVRFAFNDFSFVDRPTGFRRLEQCNAMLARLLDRHVPPEEDRAEETKGPVVKLCPFDQAIDRVLDLAERLERQTRWGPTLLEDCRQAADARTLATPDREKVQALWAATALRLGADEAALEPLRQLRATYPFGDWATEHLNRMED